jgi:hypothetical protein
MVVTFCDLDALNLALKSRNLPKCFECRFMHAPLTHDGYARAVERLFDPGKRNFESSEHVSHVHRTLFAATRVAADRSDSAGSMVPESRESGRKHGRN